METGGSHRAGKITDISHGKSHLPDRFVRALRHKFDICERAAQKRGNYDTAGIKTESS
jgi:hypothetical protein